MNYVTQIHAAILSTASSVLGANWVELRKVFNPAENDFRTIEMGYGARHGEAPNFAGALEAFVYDQAFELVLSRRATNRDNDQDIQVVINDLYDKMDNCFRQIILTRLGLSPIVLDISQPSMAAPEVLDNGGVILVGAFNVKHWLDRIVT